MHTSAKYPCDLALARESRCDCDLQFSVTARCTEYNEVRGLNCMDITSKSRRSPQEHA